MKTTKPKKDPVKLDFRNFLYLAWKHLGLPEPTPVQYLIADYLQNGPRRLIVMAFRGVGKSWITSAFCCWKLLNDPQKKILVISASKERADAFSIFTKRLIGDMPILNHLKPRDDQRDSNIAFDVAPAKAAHAPSVKSIGITGQITGSRADLIIADDVEVSNNTLTQPMRDKLENDVTEFDAVLTPGGSIVYLGTPQTEETLYNTLQEKGYKARIWPARYPSKEDIISYNGNLCPVIMSQNKEPGEPTDPARFDDLDLSEREASYGRSGFARQFQLNTSLGDADRYPLKLQDLIVTTLDREKAPGKILWCNDRKHRIDDLQAIGLAGDYFYRPLWTAEDYFPYQASLMSVDPAGRGTDEVGYCVSKMLNSTVYVLKIGGIKGGYENDVLSFLARTARDYKVDLIEVEPNFGDGMYNQIFLPVLQKYFTHHWNCGLEETERSNKQKELRIIDTLEPVMNQHRLVMDYEELKRDYEKGEKERNKCLAYQLTRITRDKGSLVNDDIIDVLSMAVHYWVEFMGISQEAMFKRTQEEFLEEELTKFMEHATGQPKHRSNPKWVKV